MEQDSARGASAFLLIPPIDAQRAMGPGTAVWHVGRCPRVFWLELCAKLSVRRYGTLYLGGRARFAALAPPQSQDRKRNRQRIEAGSKNMVQNGT